MKKRLLMGAVIIAVMAFFCGCYPVITALKGTYQNKPYEITSDKSYDEVWSNVIDLFATKGLSIKVIDKTSGLIVSEKTSFINNYTTEDPYGKPSNPDAWVAVGTISYYGNDVPPQRIEGEWNVRIKAGQNGKTTINVNLTNIEAGKHIAGSQYSAEQNLVYPAMSTGKFEAMIADIVK